MSSSIRSGFSSDAARTAAKPSGQSPTTSIAGSAWSSFRSAARASPSSSTMTARSLEAGTAMSGGPGGTRALRGRPGADRRRARGRRDRCRGWGLDRRQGDLDAERVAGGADGRLRLVSVQAPQAIADVGQPDPFAAAGGALRIAGVLDQQDDAPAQPPRRDGDRAPLEEVGHAVAHRVLDLRLQQERRDGAAERRLVDLLKDPQALSEADLLDRQVVADQRQLVPQGDPLPGAQRQAP